MFAVIYKDYYMEEGYDRGDPPNRVEYEKTQKFKTKEELLEWIRRNDNNTYSKKEFEAIEYTPLKVTKKIEISVG